MGDSETGGDGSVQWTVDVDHVKKDPSGHSRVKCIDVGAHGHHQEGYDGDGDPGDVMTVSIKAPQGKTASGLLNYLKNTGLTIDGDRVYFNIAIEQNNGDQVRLSWGNSNHKKTSPPPMP